MQLKSFSLIAVRGAKTVLTNEGVQLDLSDGLKNLESEEENLDEEDRVEFDKEVDELEKALGLEEDE